MQESEFLELQHRVIDWLEQGLDPRLTYHSPAHTIDVLLHAERISIAENITDPRLLFLIKIAALFHDTGFLYTYKEHEKKSCEILTDTIDLRAFAESEIELMKGMIMATKVPQQPKNLPEMILCDADLDYLGRNDFERISNNLKEELLAYGFIKEEKEWDKLQVNFFESHLYFTGTAIQDRYPVKMEHLALLKQKLVSFKS